MVAPKEDMRKIPISCCVHQTKDKMQEWLGLLADNITPELVIKKVDNDKPAEIIKCKLEKQGRSFTISYRGQWQKLVAAFHDLSGNNGGWLTRYLRELNVMLGDCGPEIGRKQFCTVNAWVQDNKTNIEFVGNRLL